MQPDDSGLLDRPLNRAKWSLITRSQTLPSVGIPIIRQLYDTRKASVCRMDFICISYRVQRNPAQLHRAKRKKTASARLCYPSTPLLCLQSTSDTL